MVESLLALFTENPFPLALIGSLLTGALLLNGWSARHRGILSAGVLAAALTVALLVAERAIVTPTEEIKATLASIARSLQENRTEQLESWFAPGREELAKETARHLRFVEFESVSIKRNLRVKFHNPDKTRAEVSFNGTARLKSDSGQWQGVLIARYLIVQLDRIEGHWRVVGYQHLDPREGI